MLEAHTVLTSPWAIHACKVGGTLLWVGWGGQRFRGECPTTGLSRNPRPWCTTSCWVWRVLWLLQCTSLPDLGGCATACGSFSVLRRGDFWPRSSMARWGPAHLQEGSRHMGARWVCRLCTLRCWNARGRVPGNRWLEGIKTGRGTVVAVIRWQSDPWPSPKRFELLRGNPMYLAGTRLNHSAKATRQMPSPTPASLASSTHRGSRTKPETIDPQTKSCKKDRHSVHVGRNKRRTPGARAPVRTLSVHHRLHAHVGRRDVHLAGWPSPQRAPPRGGGPTGRRPRQSRSGRRALDHRPGWRSCLRWRTQIRCTHSRTDPVQV